MHGHNFMMPVHRSVLYSDQYALWLTVMQEEIKGAL